MTLLQMLGLLADADEGLPSSTARRGRFLVLLYQFADAEDTADAVETTGVVETADAVEASNLGDDELGARLRVVGEADSLLGALDRLGQELLAELPDGELSGYLPGAAESVVWFDEDAEQEVDLTELYRRLRTPARLAVFAFVSGALSGPFYVVNPEEAAADCYLAGAQRRFVGARLVFGMGAAPPNHEQAWCILELQPTGSLSPAERALHQASTHGDVEALDRALADGARVDAVDERGMAALHLAVAHRRGAAVAALLAAGADANQQAAYGDAPLFAQLGADGLVRPEARRIEDEAHWALLQQLVEHGADVNARSTSGWTLVDVLLEGPGYPSERLAWARTRGGQSARIAGYRVGELVGVLPWGDVPALQRQVNWLRHVLESGGDANDRTASRLGVPPLQALIGTTGYSPREVPGEILEEMVGLLLRYGAREGPGYLGKTALEQAETWLKHGFSNYEGVIRLLRPVQEASRP